MEIIERFIAEKIVDLINSILNASVEHYNIIMKNAIDLLKQSPENWNGGSGWSLMNLSLIYISYFGSKRYGII